MLSLLLFVFSALFFGEVIFRLLRIHLPGTTQYYTLSFGLGTACWYLLLFTLGHIGLLYPWLLATCAATASGAFCIILSRRITIRRFRPRRWLHWFNSTHYVDILLIAAVILILVLTFASTFAPVVGGVANDSINYHLSVPAQWLRHNKIIEVSWPISYLAGYGDLLYTLPLALGSVTGTKLISWIFMCASLVLAAGFTARQVCTRAGYIAAVVWIANPLVFRTSYTAFIDLQAAFFATCALWCAIRFSHTGRHRMILLSGLFIGTGCGIKPTIYCYAIALGAVVTVMLVREHRKPLRTRTKKLLLYGLCSVLFAAPWPVRNTILTTSPSFPPPLMYYHLTDTETFHFGDVSFSREDARIWFGKCNTRTRTHGDGIRDFLLLPWNITMHPGAFQAGDSVTAILLSFLPLIFLAGARPRWIHAIMFFSLSGTALVYFVLYPEARFFIPVFLAISPAIAWCIVKLARYGHNRITLAVTVAMTFNVLFACAVAFRLCLPKIGTVIDRQYRHRYMKAHIPYYEAFNYLASYADRHVVVFYNHQTMFYLENDYVVDSTAAGRPGRYPEALFLDIDYSQSCRRDTAHATEAYWLPENPDSLHLVFEGPDARIYRFESTRE